MIEENKSHVEELSKEVYRTAQEWPQGILRLWEQDAARKDFRSLWAFFRTEQSSKRLDLCGGSVWRLGKVIEHSRENWFRRKCRANYTSFWQSSWVAVLAPPPSIPLGTKCMSTWPRSSNNTSEAAPFLNILSHGSQAIIWGIFWLKKTFSLQTHSFEVTAENKEEV